jgi:PAS domain S-box-containing protein
MEILTVLQERYFSADKGALDPASQGCRLDGSGEGGADDPTFHQALIDAMPDPVLAVTADHRVIYANAAAAFHHGVTPVAMVGRPVRDFVGRDHHAAEISEAIDACLGDSGRSFSFRFPPSAPTDADLRTIVRAIPTQGRRMGCVLVIEQDVSDI